MLRFILLLALILPVYPAALAAEDNVKKYRNFSPQQIRALPKQTIDSEVPVMYTMAANLGISEDSSLYFGMQLNQLMYSGLHDYTSAVKDFQSDLGDKPDGNLTVWQIHQLGKRAEMQKLSRVHFPDSFHSWIIEDYAFIEGTMAILDEQIAWPVNHVRISCSKVLGTCELDEIDLVFPDDTSWSQTYSLLQPTTISYEIARWSGDTIESLPDGDSKNCRNTSFSFNFKTKEFYFTTRNGGGDCKLLTGSELEKLKKPRISQIIDGNKIIEDSFSKIEKDAYNSLSSQFIKKVDELTGKN